MAEEALKKIEEGLNCAICLDTYTDPKLLQCFHVYCRKCLVPLVVRDQQGQLGLTCPTCRHITPIPDRGVAGLQSAFHINHLLEIQDSVKKLDNPTAALEGGVGGAALVPPRDAVRCFEHSGEEVKLYCEACGELLCYKCIIKGGKHHSHDYKELDQAFQQYKEEITSSLEPMEKQINVAKKSLAQLDARCGEISSQQAVTSDTIHATFGQLQEVLKVREIELISQLDKVTQNKLKCLATQRDQIETNLAQRSSCLHFMKETLGTSNKEDVLTMKTNTVLQVRELTTPFPPDTLEPNTEADIVLSGLADMIVPCQNCGQVVAPRSADPSKCHATGWEVAVVGENSTLILHTVNFDNRPCEEQIESLQCELVSEIAGDRVSCSVERTGQSQYEISYQPVIKGRHHLHIEIDDQHIRGSPFGVLVKSPVEKLGTPILSIGMVDTVPWRAAISQRGEVMVVEDRHCVTVLSPTGEKVRSFGPCGSGQGQFKNPCGIAVDGEGDILVVDGNHHIQRFTADGQFLAAVGTKGSGPLQFSFPTDIASNASNGRVYVTDTVNDRVQVLNSDLTFCSSFGRSGNGKGQLDRPLGIACDSTGKVYVADRGNHRIQVFTAEGKFFKMFGRRGQGRGELDTPVGIAIDSSDLVYVSEIGNSRVSVFTSKGHVTSFGRFGSGEGEFSYPGGLAVDISGVVYVCDRGNNRIQVF